VDLSINLVKQICQTETEKDSGMSSLNQRGIFLQLMLPGPTEPNTIVSMQLAQKIEVWDAVTRTVSEVLIDSISVTATSSDRGETFSISTLGKDIDRDGDIDNEDKVQLQALAKAYAKIVNP
jgi:hypothetical protein